MATDERGVLSSVARARLAEAFRDDLAASLTEHELFAAQRRMPVFARRQILGRLLKLGVLGKKLAVGGSRSGFVFKYSLTALGLAEARGETAAKDAGAGSARRCGACGGEGHNRRTCASQRRTA